MTSVSARTRSSRNSIVELFDSSTNTSSCGYCKGTKATDGRQKQNRGAQGDSSDLSESETSDQEPETSIALGMMAYTVSNIIFNDLLDRGWSRSGRYLYKPIMARTCCPQYTIRLDVNKFRLSRTQKRVLRNMNQFLVDDKRPSMKINENGCPNAAGDAQEAKNRQEKPKDEPEKLESDYEKPTKKKEMRRKRCFEKLAARGVDIEQFKRDRAKKEEARQRTVASYILPHEESHKHRLEVRLVREGSSEFQDRYDEEVDLYLKYQMAVHNDLKASRRGFEGFLANSPLVYEAGDDGFPGYGSFHQLYLLDDKIVAVGVMDLLPLCLSSKYFFYDPDFAFLALGTYSALREIEFTQRMHIERPELQFYYMGYYLEECPKMKYKGRFRPSELMCDKTFKWMPLEKAIGMINANNNRFTQFFPDEERPGPPPLDDIRIICKDSTTMAQRLVSARMYKMMNPDDREFEVTLTDYLDLAGPVATQICIYRSHRS
ncbi:hypothetical protein L596_009389 [Steinernema carpocapsae]|uniref:Arginyl-tRNA--protein transferase 1 n=1 Tax=Steinernema carpocapsae TaxID=34508 RepID=A0A4U5PFE2_STECR|nr:hypothetical protein L596_009389 [Steinernema carpocapsae]